MILVLFIVEVVFFSLLEKKIYGTIFTPASILGVPYVIVMSVNLIWGYDYGFFPVYMKSIWVWVIGYFIFCLIGFFMAVFFIGHTDKVKGPFTLISKDIDSTMKLLQIISLFCVVIMYFKLWISLRAFGMEYRSEEFMETLGHGINAHANLLLLICVIYFMIISKLRWHHLPNFIFIFLWASYAFFYNSKSWILIPVMAGLIGRYLYYNKKIRLIHLVIIIAGGILIFYLSYSLSFGHWAPWWFIKKHFITYTNSGILGLSEHIKTHQDVGLSLELLFQPIVNIFHVITGSSAKNVISDIRIMIGESTSTNVRTFFGTVYVYGGLWGGILTIIIWSIFVYLPLVLTIRLRNLIVGVIYLFIAATLVYGWFETYLNQLPAYEIYVLGVFVMVVDAFNNQKGKLHYYNIKEK
ncbi:DUF6337 family protein [Saccharicrinis sp. FJH62]|uniref:DUF6337 family protein n=1 Tax=Saccharicrinis sp. FJH62 TaxID=3344657 RepID=UPI0035D4821C